MGFTTHMFKGSFNAQPPNLSPGPWLTAARWLGGTALGLILGLRLGAQATANDLGDTISYQGRLQVGGQAAHGSYDFQFVLVDAAEAGQAWGNPLPPR